MVKILKKINILMNGRQKRQMVGLFCMMAVSAFLETGAVMMVMAVVEILIRWHRAGLIRKCVRSCT